MTTTSPSENWFKRMSRSTKIPPVYFFLIIVFLFTGILDQIYSDGQIFTNPIIMLNIIVRSVALGIVAVGQTLVLIGASIDLSVAYTISITAVMSSYIMQGNNANVPVATSGCFCDWDCDRACQWLDHHQAPRESIYRHTWRRA